MPLTDLVEVSKAKAREEQALEAKRWVEAKAWAARVRWSLSTWTSMLARWLAWPACWAPAVPNWRNSSSGSHGPDSGALSSTVRRLRLSPRESLRNGVALCPEDRKAEGIVGDLNDPRDNSLALQARNGWIKHLNVQKQNEIAQRVLTCWESPHHHLNSWSRA